MTLEDANPPCEKARALLGDYLEGLLGAQDRSALEAHLDDCAGCREALEVERRFLAMLSGIERETAPVGFSDRIMASIFPSPASWRQVRGAESQPSAWSRLSFAGAVLLLLLIMGQWFMPSSTGPSGAELLRDSATIALLEGGRELSGTVETMEQARDRVRQFSRPTLGKIQSILGSQRVILNAIPSSLLVLIVLVGLAPLVLVFTLYRLRLKGAMSNVLVLARPN